MYITPPHLWLPQARGIMGTIDVLNRGKIACLHAPTGGGKTEQAMQLFRWAQSLGLGGIFYINRKLLIAQTADRMLTEGLDYGIRAADYDEAFDAEAPFQLASIDTEASRVLERKIWKPHDVGPGGVVVVDEAHLMKTKAMRLVLDDHLARGARVVLLTATPVGLAKWADEIVMSGTMQEYRDCKALVKARVYSPNQPDMRKVKRNPTGEYIFEGKLRTIFTQSIVESVYKKWCELNPHARPAMMYAPGKAESVWLTDQFRQKGVNWCHVDATDAVVDGKRYRLTRQLWKDILARYKANEIKGLSSRFKLREGLDVKETYHCILATPIGSLASYIQTVGRILRYSSATPDGVIVTDHGGNYWRHGSPNSDRPWGEWWDLPEHAIAEMHANSIKDKKVREPICCPKCGTERLGGIRCLCGFEHAKSMRHVVMEDGTMKDVSGCAVPARREVRKPGVEEKYEKMFWGYRNKKVNQSFHQLLAYFEHTHGYPPPRDLKLMPKITSHWCRKVHEVALADLN